MPGGSCSTTSGSRSFTSADSSSGLAPGVGVIASITAGSPLNQLSWSGLLVESVTSATSFRRVTARPSVRRTRFSNCSTVVRLVVADRLIITLSPLVRPTADWTFSSSSARRTSAAVMSRAVRRCGSSQTRSAIFWSPLMAALATPGRAWMRGMMLRRA
jgi:hypothetical protein